MAGKPPFDTVRAAFYLIAGVIAVHCLVVLITLVFCWTHPEQEATLRCGSMRDQLTQLLAAALAAALALAGGLTRKDK